MDKQFAETLGAKALAWIAVDEDRLRAFLAATGVDPQGLRARAKDPEFLGAVLDFLTSDDALVIGFCDAENLDYAVPLRARQALPGGELPHWT